MTKGYIYGLVCPFENTIKYVGQTTRRLSTRLKGHKSTFYQNKKKLEALSAKDAWFLTLQQAGRLKDLKIVKLEECVVGILNERETYWIERYKTLNFHRKGTFKR